MPLQAQGEFALVKEQLERALDLAGQPVKRGTMAHKHIVYMMLTDAAARLGDEPAARHYAALLEQLAIRDGHQPYLAVAQRALGVVHRLGEEYGEAETRLTEALALFGERDAHWQIGRTLAEMAELALAQSDKAGARDYYGRALVEFEAIGARPDMERIRTALEAV
ncbi:MAG: hypothetical protein R3300_07170 [Candidatus Promineifilaceae bacterium]|nr:hypothetical protein [Candidatus Promineifilaceae bacterium]